MHSLNLKHKKCVIFMVNGKEYGFTSNFLNLLVIDKDDKIVQNLDEIENIEIDKHLIHRTGS